MKDSIVMQSKERDRVRITGKRVITPLQVIVGELKLPFEIIR
jgi:hypothetical protein